MTQDYIVTHRANQTAQYGEKKISKGWIKVHSAFIFNISVSHEKCEQLQQDICKETYKYI